MNTFHFFVLSTKFIMEKMICAAKERQNGGSVIHRYKMHDTNIVVDVNSGAVHQFDDIAYDIVGKANSYPEYKEDISRRKQELIERYGNDKVVEAMKEIKTLADNQMLFTEDGFEGIRPMTSPKPVLKALCLHICHDCNLRCEYCFAGKGDFGGKRSMMSAEVGKKAIDLLIAQSGSRRNLEVDFFGGEPLMNFGVVKEILEYARSKEKENGKNFRFTITTNAVLINDDNMNYINENMQNVVLSIDGRKETNDKMRHRLDGTGSYQAILPKIKKMVKARNDENYYVRGTFTRHNIDFSNDVISLADEGFASISVEPVVAGDGSGYEIREEDIPALFDEYEKLAKIYVDRKGTDKEFQFFHFMIDLNQGPCIAKRLTGCGAGHEYVAVTPDGDLYPCHQFVGKEEFMIGNVFHGINNEEIRMKFKGSNIYTKPECVRCWAKFYCSGGCAANAWQFNQDINSPYFVGCELERKRVEAALWIKCARAE